jgi:antitoxin component YwqK of YwqJK toxin-antitoxin module
MKNSFLLILGLLAASCQSKTDRQMQLPPDLMVMFKDPNLHNANGTWMYKGSKFNGYIIEKSNSTLTAKLPVIDGKTNGIAYGWYKNGSKKSEQHFLNGDREGTDKSWHENGRLAFKNFFQNDKYEGVQKAYYPSGHRFQILNYKNGYEEGRQKSWSDDGRVINNFTVKKGKLYGVVGRYDCMSVIKK